MPCSCKVKTQTDVKYTVPRSRQTKVTEVKSVIKQQDTSTYDFSATTKPAQLCLNCVAKHIGLAYLTLRQAAPSSLVAAGELMCASQHLAGLEKPASYYMQKLALSILRRPSAVELQKELGQILQTLYLTGNLPQEDQRPVLTNDLQIYLLQLLLVYCLMFTQVMYQKVNKGWAVAHLSHSSLEYFRVSRDAAVFGQARQIWKLLQDIKDYNTQYYTAKYKLWSFIEDLYEQYTNTKAQEKV